MLVSDTVVTTLSVTFWPNCLSESETGRRKETEWRSTNSPSSDFSSNHTQWHTSIKPLCTYAKLIEKLKPGDQDWIRRLLMSAFYHPSGLLTVPCKLNLIYTWRRNLWICCFFFPFLSANYLGSTRNTLSSLRHVPLWHNILLLKEKNEGCVGALIQHLFKQMKSQWRFWRRNLLIPLWLTCRPKTLRPQCNLADDALTQ